MNKKDFDTSEAKADDTPIDVKYEPLAIKDEFPITTITDCIYSDIREKAYVTIKTEYGSVAHKNDAAEEHGITYVNIKTEYSSVAYMNDAAEEHDTDACANYKYNVKQELNDYTESDHSTATSDSKLFATTDILLSEAHDFRLLDTKIYQCDICQQMVSTAEHLFAHRYTHTDDTNFTCLVCRSTFHKKQGLNRHMLNSHTNLSPYRCEIFHKPFTQKSTAHKLIHKGDKRYECDICFKIFIKKDQLTMHKRFHTGEKLYKCDICHKSFIQQSNLTAHKRILNGEKLYKCKICWNKSYSRKADLTMHAHTNHDLKSYECDLCYKLFTRKGELTMHKRIHTGEKPYECDICHKSFIQKCSLTTHKRTHTGEKPYKCNICVNKSYRQKSDLTIHTLMNHDGKSYECDLCYKLFTKEGELTIHTRIHHGEKPLKM